MSNGNGNGKHSGIDFTAGVWAVVGLAGGLNVIGRFMGSVSDQSDNVKHLNTEGPPITRESIEKALETEKWIMLDRAFSFALIPGSANGQPVLAPMCMPFAGAHDGEIPVGIQIANITTTMFFDEMPEATRRQFQTYANNGNASAQKLRAATAGVVLAR